MKLRELFSNTIFRQLVLFTILVSIVPIILITVFLYLKIENLVLEELMKSQEMLTSQYVENIANKLDKYQESLELISNNTVVLETMKDTSGNPYVKGNRISEEVMKSLRLENQSEVRNCMIYSEVENAPIFGKSISVIEEARREHWYAKSRIEGEGFFIYQANNLHGVLSVVKNIWDINLGTYEMKQLGIIKLDFIIDKLLHSGMSQAEQKFSVILYNSEEEVIYTSGDSAQGFFADLQRGDKLSQLKKPIETEEYILYTGTIPEYDFNFLVLFDNHELTMKRREVIYIVLPLSLILLVIILVVAFSYTKSVSSKVEKLLRKFGKAEKGDFKLEEPVGGNDELALLDQAFSVMLERLDHLIKVNYVQKLENKETQLNNLQLQISPHFLYNTLETISSMAAVNHTYEICEMCEKLGSIFRYSLGKDYGEFVTVKQELHHAQNYLHIQKIRYGSRFDVRYEINESVKDRMVLRFILQPIVENAIVHGLCEAGEGNILVISICEETDYLVIRIKDDGAGMDLNHLEDLRVYIDDPNLGRESKRSIGVRNVHQRIKMSCGDNYGIRIDSELHKGSCFALWLPLE